jgi:hypothetical protein
LTTLIGWPWPAMDTVLVRRYRAPSCDVFLILEHNTKTQVRGGPYASLHRNLN